MHCWSAQGCSEDQELVEPCEGGASASFDTTTALRERPVNITLKPSPPRGRGGEGGQTRRMCPAEEAKVRPSFVLVPVVVLYPSSSSSVVHAIYISHFVASFLCVCIRSCGFLRWRRAKTTIVKAPAAAVAAAAAAAAAAVAAPVSVETPRVNMAAAVVEEEEEEEEGEEGCGRRGR